MVRHVIFMLLVVVGAVRSASAQGDPAAEPAAAPPRRSTSYKTVQRLAPPISCDRITSATGLPHTNVRAIAQDLRGFVWFGTGDGLARYDGTKMRVYRPAENDPHSLSSSFVNTLRVDATGKLWIGTTESGVNLYDPETDQFTRFQKGPGELSSEGVAAIARDSKDRMWFAMSDGGLNRFEPSTGNFSEHLAKPLDVTITAIASDAAGNLWLGTEQKRVLRWNPDDGSTADFDLTAGTGASLGTAPIKTIVAASSGKIWIGTDGDGLFELDPKTAKMVRHQHAPADSRTITDDHVSVLFEDKRQVLWIGTPQGLNRLDGSGQLVRYQYDPEDPNNPTNLSVPAVESIFQDDGGVMWVGGFTDGACKFDESRRQFGHYKTSKHSLSYFEDPDGTLWVGTYAGLYKLEPALQQVTIYHSLGRNLDGDPPLNLDSIWITSLHRDRRGTLWVALKGQGLTAFDTKNEAHRHYPADPEDPAGLPVDTMFDMWEDPNGLLWLATWGSGLVRLDPATEMFTVVASADDSAGDTGLTSNHLYKIYPDPTDPQILWLGTAKGGLVRYNIANNAATAFRNREDDATSLSMDDVTSIHREPSGAVWVGTYGAGLNRLDPSTGKAERFTAANSGLPNNTVFGILPDPEGKLWMSTNGGGLVQLDPKTRTFLSYGASDGMQHDEFAQGSSMLSKSGTMYFGGLGGFNAFVPGKIKRDSYVPPVVATAFKIGNQEVKLDRPIWTLPALEVSYTDSFEVQFAALAFAAPDKNRYAFKLDGYDSEFVETDRPFAQYKRLPGGDYTLRVRAANRHGVWNETALALKLSVTPPIWRTWPAYGLYLLLLAGAAFLLIRIQREKLLRAEREGRLAVVERDLELTGIVQTGFLPEHPEIQTERIQLCGLYRPADACGGDWWWHEPLSGNRHVILVGDVTGHGPGPAMVTAAVATAFRVLIEHGLDDVQQGLEMLNRQVLRVAKGKYHMTMAAFEIEETTGRWVLYSAGAPPMLSLGQNGKHRVHFCPGAPLGTETGFETGRVEGKLNPTDRILLYTDGIPEIEFGNGNVMGMRRFAQQYERTRGDRLREAADSILAHADATLGNGPQTDDWTFTMIEWN